LENPWKRNKLEKKYPTKMVEAIKVDFFPLSFQTTKLRRCHFFDPQKTKYQKTAGFPEQEIWKT